MLNKNKSNSSRAWLIALGIFFSSVLLAQEEKEVVFAGLGTLDHISYFQEASNKINSRNEATLDLFVKADLLNKSTLEGSIEYRNDWSNEYRTRLFLNELFIDLFFENIDIRIGQQIVNWGQTDGINPLNNINPIDFTDFFESGNETRPIFATRVKYYFRNAQVDFILSPVFAPSLLTTDRRNRWLNLPDVIPNPADPTRFLNASYQFESAQFEHNIKDDFQIGLKVSNSSKWGDWGFSYYYGYNDVPKYLSTVQQESLDSVSISLSPSYYKWHVAGLDFATSIGPWGLRGELGFFFSENGQAEIKDAPFSQFVIGLDRNIANLFGERNLFIIVQWIQDIIYKDQVIDSNDLNHIFKNTGFLRLEQEISAFAKCTIQTMFDFKHKTLYIQPSFTYEFHQGIKLEVLADLIHAYRTTSFFYNYQNNDRIQFKMKYAF